MFYESIIQRRVSRQIKVGNVLVGGGAPISVQSMTNTEPRCHGDGGPDPGA